MKFTKILIAAALLATMVPALTSCADDDAPLAVYPVSLSISLPDEISEAEILSELYSLKNVSTGREQSFSSKNDIEVIPGLYDITYMAKVRMPNGVETTLRAQSRSVQITSGENNVQLQAYNTIESNDLIIAEVFFTGTTTATGAQHRGDDYIKLYNNTDHVVYADGISIFESNFNTTTKYDYTPDIMGQAVAVWSIYTVPGDGTRFPVAPGEYFLIADNAYDHRTVSDLSFDLSGAACEWYDESQVASMQEVDNPSVPNMDKVYCYTRSIYLLANGGNRAYGIARLGMSAEEYLSDNYYEYTYPLVTVSGSYDISGNCYKIPNSMILDVVNCSTQTGFAWTVTSPALDCGWTYCALNNSDKTRFFTSVRRKMLYLNDEGNPVLKDTNNSTEDFNARVIPSEIEIQGTAINADGEKATTRTYDGVTPIK